MSTLVSFLRHYLDEEERAARSAMEAGNAIWYSPSTGVVVVGVDNGVFDMITFPDGRTARHVVLHDPQSVLVDVLARQQILGKVLDALQENERLLEYDRGGGDWHETGSGMLLRLLAARYSSEAGFQEAWRVPGLDNRVNGGASRILDGELVQRELGIEIHDSRMENEGA